MRLRGRQARFLVMVLGGWVALRTVMLWPIAAVSDLERKTVSSSLTSRHWDSRTPAQAGVQSREDRVPGVTPDFPSPGTEPRRAPGYVPASGSQRPTIATREAGAALGPYTGQIVRKPRDEPVAAFPSQPTPTSTPRRIDAQAYLFLRPGSGRALASGSALGGSQAAARIAVPIDEAGRFAAAARLYAPLNGKGAEAALGLDWHPAPAIPARISVERRQRVDAAGRSAWSAYAAGGFYRALPGAVLLDGYAQAGIVGVHTRDMFADGAVRIERAIPIGRIRAGIGAGLWAAAQPGAERIDMGPRASLRLPVADHALTLAIEGRFRIAGRARPGSGVAVTLAADL